MQSRTGKPLKCFCSRSPILAFYGVNDKGELYVHIKIYKARHVYGEIITTSGNITIRCRECLRWHTLVLSPDSGTASLVETEEVPIHDDESVTHG